MINPKELFQQSLKPESQFRTIIRSTEMQSAITYAFAQFSISNPTTEESTGARKWVEIFTNLAEPTPPPTTFPDKRLDPSLMNPSLRAKEKKKATKP